MMALSFAIVDAELNFSMFLEDRTNEAFPFGLCRYDDAFSVHLIYSGLLEL